MLAVQVIGNRYLPCLVLWSTISFSLLYNSWSDISGLGTYRTNDPVMAINTVIYQEFPVVCVISSFFGWKKASIQCQMVLERREYYLEFIFEILKLVELLHWPMNRKSKYGTFSFHPCTLADTTFRINYHYQKLRVLNHSSVWIKHAMVLNQGACMSLACLRVSMAPVSFERINTLVRAVSIKSRLNEYIKCEQKASNLMELL